MRPYPSEFEEAVLARILSGEISLNAAPWVYRLGLLVVSHTADFLEWDTKKTGPVMRWSMPFRDGILQLSMERGLQ